MDIRMPVIDGLTASRKIRENEAYDHIKIIAVSATVLPQMQDEIIRCGCDAFLGKPVDARILFAEIEKQLGVEMTALNADLDLPSEEAPVGVVFDLADSPERDQVHGLLEQIAGAATHGDIAQLRQLLDRLGDLLGAEYPLVLRLLRMSEHFEMDAIVRLLQQTLENTSEDPV